MRIAFVSTILGYPWGGADTLWTRAAEAARNRGDELLISVSAAVAHSPRIAALAAAGATIHERTPPTPPVSFLARASRKLRHLVGRHTDSLVAAIDAFGPDCVIISQGGTYDLVLHPLLVSWLHSSGTKYRIIANWQQEQPQLDDANLAFIRDVFAAANNLNFVSNRNLAVTRRHLAVPLPNARVIQNPLRWQATDAEPWRPDAIAQLATVSRLEEGKGIQLLLRALANAGATLPAWRLNIYGSGPYEARLGEEVERLGLGGSVRFHGYVTELHSIWAANQLMASPALDEGVPMTIPEAMLCQRPVLATCVGGAEDWVTQGETGFLCPTPTVSDLSATLLQAFAARDHWETMGRAAAVSAARQYRADDYLKLISA